MLPNLRFTIGAVLVSALLIVSAFGMAANVRIAHHRAVGPLEAARILAYADPMDWGSRPTATRRVVNAADNVPLLERITAISLDPDETVLTSRVVEHEPPDDSAGATPSAEVSTPSVLVTAGCEPPSANTAVTDCRAPVTELATAAEETTAVPRAEQAQAAVPPAPKEASPSATKVTKRVAKKRRLPAQAKSQQPPATARHPVTYDGANFDGPYFYVWPSTAPSATCATDAWRCRSGS